MNRYRIAINGFLVFMLPLLAIPFTLLPVAAAGSGQSSASAAPVSAPDFAKIDAFVSSEMHSNQIPGLSLGIVRGMQVAHLQGFGAADSTGRGVTPQTPFIIGSTSKSFTALAVMQLVEAGKVELDAPVRRYVPWFRVADLTASAGITVRQLLNQTSGLPGTSDYEANEGFLNANNLTLEQYVRGLNTQVLDRRVGSSFEYANNNYVVLGLVVQTVSGQSYETYVQQHIFSPLQMNHSYVSAPAAQRDELAQGYQLWFGLPVPDTKPYPRDLLPAGYIISTAEDLAHYLIAQISGGTFANTAVLSPTGIATMHAPAVEMFPGASYGMGWVNGPSDGVPTIWHNGSTGNFYSVMILAPDSQWGIVVLTNQGGLPAILLGSVEGIAIGVLDALVGHQQMPLGPGLGATYLVFDGILVLISALVLWSTLRVRHWSERFERRWRRPGRFRRAFNIVGISFRLLWELLLPAFLLGVPALTGYLAWRAQFFNAPDIATWLLVILALMLMTGIIRARLMADVVRSKKMDRLAITPSPARNLM